MLNVRISIFVLLILLLCPLIGQTIEISQSLDKFETDFEDSVQFEITVQWDGPPHAYLFNKPLNPTFSYLKAGTLSSRVSSIGSGEDEKTTKKFKFILYPTQSGQAIIEPINVKYLKYADSTEGELVTEMMTVTVAAPIPIEKSKGVNPYYIILFGFLISVGILLTVIIVKNKKNKEISKPEKTNREIFLEKLSEIKNNAGSNLKEFQSGLYNILLEFFMNEYKLDLSEVDDEDITKKIDETKLTQFQKENLTGWLLKAKKDRYQPLQSSPGETIRLESEIRNLFENM
ncbi:MAG: hypothetical protein DRP35_09835 [Candidatus Zixiibacteriota bacterium]|nr:MAG: hypothetical protein DRP35_09835 [candidate division Zixibacteria bacterium]